MKDYIECLRALRDSLDKVRDELTDTLKHKFGSLEDTEVYLMKAQVDRTEKYIDVLDALISHATLKEPLKEDEK